MAGYNFVQDAWFGGPGVTTLFPRVITEEVGSPKIPPRKAVKQRAARTRYVRQLGELATLFPIYFNYRYQQELANANSRTKPIVSEEVQEGSYVLEDRTEQPIAPPFRKLPRKLEIGGEAPIKQWEGKEEVRRKGSRKRKASGNTLPKD